MSGFSEIIHKAGSRQVRALHGGKGREVTVLLHGGVAGAELYASGAHIWGDVPGMLAKDRRVIAIDLPGQSEGLEGPGDFTVEALAAAAEACMPAEPVHFVGHELGAMVGVYLAITKPALIKSLSIVTSPMTAPTADAVSNVTSNHPPKPYLSRSSQEWALEKLSYGHGHITTSLLDECNKAAASDYQNHILSLGAGLASAQVRQSMRRTQLLQWETCRNGGFQVPVQVIWAAQDPLASRAANYLLFSTIAEKQRSAQFHIVNRSGSLPFLEQPEIFFEMVAAWQDGVAAEFS